MQKKTKKTPVKQKKKAQSPKKKNDQPFSLKRLIMGEEKPDLTELEAGSPLSWTFSPPPPSTPKAGTTL